MRDQLPIGQGCVLLGPVSNSAVVPSCFKTTRSQCPSGTARSRSLLPIIQRVTVSTQAESVRRIVSCVSIVSVEESRELERCLKPWNIVCSIAYSTQRQFPLLFHVRHLQVAVADVCYSNARQGISGKQRYFVIVPFPGQNHQQELRHTLSHLAQGVPLVHLPPGRKTEPVPWLVP